MIIFPAIDISEGQCVRLFKGNYQNKKIYHDNPLDVAYRWKDQGATHLHIVDLDGAKYGELKHLSLIKNMVKKTGLTVQLGGGIRSIKDIKSCLDAGIFYPIVGTKAIVEKKFLEKAYALFPQNITIALDSKNGYLATQGWLQSSTIKVHSFIQKIDSLGIKRVICTDIERDGTLKGPHLKHYVDLIALTKNISITVSGGISSLNDLIKIFQIKNKRIESIIIGKALYENCFSLKEALALC